MSELSASQLWQVGPDWLGSEPTVPADVPNARAMLIGVEVFQHNLLVVNGILTIG